MALKGVGRYTKVDECSGCDDRRGPFRYGLCPSCRKIGYYARPKHRHKKLVQKRAFKRPVIVRVPEVAPAIVNSVCTCGRDYLTVPLEEAVGPCPGAHA